VCVLCKTFDVPGDKVAVYTSLTESLTLDTHPYPIHGDGTRFENRLLKISATFSCISDGLFVN
jgi:hypothetical protein